MKHYDHILGFIKSNFVKLSIIFIGFFSLMWFLVRVIPKPSRAAYPCQRAAFPIATTFILWTTGALFSGKILKKAKLAFVKGNSLKAILFTFLALSVFAFSLFVIPIKDSVSGSINYSTIVQNGELLYAKEKAEITESIIDPKATVAIVKSEKANAADITFDDINSMIHSAVEMAGGFDTLIHEGDLVVIKPNVIAARAQGASFSNSFPQEANGIATDYRLIQVVVNMVREKNASGKIILIEGSGYGLTRKNINAIGYNKITGLDSIICLDENIVKWYDTTSVTLQKVLLPKGKNLYSSKNRYYLNKVYFDADVLISLPVLKSHYLTGITGSVKNVGIGATPVEMYGNGKSFAEDDLPGRWNHIGHGDFSTQTIPLDKWIHDFYLCKPVSYVIMDGLQGAQYGPYPDGRTLKSVQKNLRVILVGKDPIAIDAIESLIEGFDPYLVGHLVLLAKDTAGCINPAFIKVKGTQVHDIKTSFSEGMPGIKCKYTDFTPPNKVTLTSCRIENNEIKVSLSFIDEVEKVEIAYDNNILESIVVNNFTDISFPYSAADVDSNKVSVLVYDKYLNCSILSLANPANNIQNREIKQLNIYPNPASAILNYELPAYSNDDWNITIISSDGKLMFSKTIKGSERPQLDISRFRPGIYILNITSKDILYTGRFNKI